ncbi:MAG: hypothetical protein AAF743_05805 [Planctomycetota bacterium]
MHANTTLLALLITPLTLAAIVIGCTAPAGPPANLTPEAQARDIAPPDQSARFTSNLFIKPGQQFVLGGGQDGRYRVTAFNKRDVSVDIYARTPAGDLTPLTTVRPGESTEAILAEGEATVLVNNDTTAEANLKVVITGDTKLAMFYEFNNDGAIGEKVKK